MLATTAHRAYMGRADCMAASIMISLLKNPLNGGMPEIDIEAIREVPAVTGNFSLNPPISLILRVPIAYSMAPLFRNRSDLNIE